MACAARVDGWLDPNTCLCRMCVFAASSLFRWTVIHSSFLIILAWAGWYCELWFVCLAHLVGLFPTSFEKQSQCIVHTQAVLRNFVCDVNSKVGRRGGSQVSGASHRVTWFSALHSRKVIIGEKPLFGSTRVGCHGFRHPWWSDKPSEKKPPHMLLSFASCLPLFWSSPGFGVGCNLSREWRNLSRSQSRLMSRCSRGL